MMSTLQPCTKKVSALSDIAGTNTPISEAYVRFISYFSVIIHICFLRNSSDSDNFSLIRSRGTTILSRVNDLLPSSRIYLAMRNDGLRYKSMSSMISLRREIVSFSKVRVVAGRPRDVDLFPLDKKFRLLNAR